MTEEKIASPHGKNQGVGGYLLARARAMLWWTRSARRERNRMAQTATVHTFKAAGQELAVVDLGRSLSSKLITDMNRRVLAIGKPLKSGGPIGTACLPIAGAGAAVASSLAAGNVFLATVNPATLMPLGGGVGSAVMSATGGGIVAQAPFVAASGALFPVVAPLLLFTTFSSMMMSVRFDRIEKTLLGMKELLEHLLEREILEDMARFLSSIERLRDIQEEYGKGLGFTAEMKMRLALVERDVSVLRHKHHALATGRVEAVLAAQLAEIDKNLFVASSIADAQVDQLRLLLALQDNPADAVRSWSALEKKVKRYEDDFRSLAENSPTEEYRSGLEKSIGDMNWWNRNVYKRKERRQVLDNLKKLDDPETPSPDLSMWREDTDSKTEAAKDPARDYSIIYWRENGGTGPLRAYYTRDYSLEATSTGCGTRAARAGETARPTS